MRRWFARTFLCPHLGHNWRRFAVIKGETYERTGQILEVCVRCFQDRQGCVE